MRTIIGLKRKHLMNDLRQYLNYLFFSNQFFYKLFQSDTVPKEEMKNEMTQYYFFKWMFTKKPSLTNFEAIVEFNKKFPGTSLLISRQISTIKSKNVSTKILFLIKYIFRKF